MPRWICQSAQARIELQLIVMQWSVVLCKLNYCAVGLYSQIIKWAYAVASVGSNALQK